MNFSSCLKTLTTVAAFGVLAIGTAVQAQDPHSPPSSPNFTPAASTLFGVEQDGNPKAGFLQTGLQTAASYDLFIRSGATITFDQIPGDATSLVTAQIDKVDGFYLIYNPRLGAGVVAGQAAGVAAPATPGVTSEVGMWSKTNKNDGNVIGYSANAFNDNTLTSPNGLTPTASVSSAGAFSFTAPTNVQKAGFPEFGFYFEAHSLDPQVGDVHGYYVINGQFNTSGIPEPAYAQLAGLLMMGGVGTLFVRLRRKSAK